MTQIEQIRAEIERLKAETFNKINHDKNRSMVTDVANSQRIAICEQLLHFIDSLPAKQPSKDLEISIIEFLGHIPENEPEHSETLYTYEQMQEIARHFAQWQKEQIMKSAVDATCVLLPPPDLFKVLICHDVTNNLSKGQKVKIITVTVKEDEQ